MKIFIIAILLSVCSGCATIENLWTDDSKCKNINFQALDEQIDKLAKDEKIRQDQAVERKKALKDEWDQYNTKMKTCEEFLNKVHYLTSV